MTRQLWQHNSSGDVFVVEVDESGKVKAACGPLHYTEFEAAVSKGFENEPADAKWLEETKESWHLKQ